MCDAERAKPLTAPASQRHTGPENWGETVAVLRRYYAMDRAEVAGTTLPEARALLAELPEILKREAQLIGAASMGSKL